jgi:integrase
VENLQELTKRLYLNRIEGGRSIEIREPKYKFIMNHTARRSFATNMYLRDVPIVSIMSITGHTTEANFLKYIKISAEEHARIVAKAFESK